MKGTILRISLGILFVLAIGVAQATANGNGCDLTYKSIMEQNKVDRIDWVQRWFATYNKPPAKKWISGWKGEPVVSSILIEYPAFHAAERSTLWLVRTKSQAYYWSSVQADWHSDAEIEKRAERLEISPKLYDSFYESVPSWKQAARLRPKQPIDGFNPEFWGFMTVNPSVSCRQILLGWDDFMGCDNCKPGPERLGRLMKELSPIFDEIRTRHYGRSK